MIRLAAFLFSLAVAGAPLAEEPVNVEQNKPAVKPVAKPAAKAAKPAAKAKVNARPAWGELTAEQQKVLAPLKADWELIDTEGRRKWIGIAKRYPTMGAQEQQRVQKRMQTWAKLTPEQRRQARENYKHLAKQPPQQRERLRQQWAEYQRQLRPEAPASQPQPEAAPADAPPRNDPA